MKTLRERATEVVEELTYCDYRTSEGVEKAERIVAKALNSAATEMRDECAKALYTCDADMSGECIWIDEAHTKVMFTQIK